MYCFSFSSYSYARYCILSHEIPMERNIFLSPSLNNDQIVGRDKQFARHKSERIAAPIVRKFQLREVALLSVHKSEADMLPYPGVLQSGRISWLFHRRRVYVAFPWATGGPLVGIVVTFPYTTEWRSYYFTCQFDSLYNSRRMWSFVVIKIKKINEFLPMYLLDLLGEYQTVFYFKNHIT